MSDHELEQFKTGINLSAYAAAQGYEFIRRESSRNSVSMKHANGDKIVITRGPDNHWVYFSVRDDADNGSIIDFVQYRRKCSLGQVRKALRSWMGSEAPYPAPTMYQVEVTKSTRNRQAVIRALGSMRDVEEHSYLVSRAIGKNITGDLRFKSRIKIDRYGNAAFPHFDEDGVCGYEIKNHNFTGFAPGGEKGLWMSRCFPDDRKLVIAESAIDALSFHGLHKDKDARYVSTAGEWNPNTSLLLQKSVEALPGAVIVLAFDNDKQGYEYEAKIRALFKDCENELCIAYPSLQGSDWNDQLKTAYLPIPAE